MSEGKPFDGKTSFETWWWNATDEDIKAHNAKIAQERASRITMADVIRVISDGIKQHADVRLTPTVKIIRLGHDMKKAPDLTPAAYITAYGHLVYFPDTYVMRYAEAFSVMRPSVRVNRWKYSCPSFGFTITANYVGNDALADLAESAIKFYVDKHTKEAV